MKHFREFVVNVLVGGLLIVVPLYLAVVLLLKAMQSLAKLVRPLAMLLPEWFPAEHLLSLLLVLLLCGLEAPERERWSVTDVTPLVLDHFGVPSAG